LLMPREESSLLEQVLSESADKEFPMTRIRREATVKLAKFLNENKHLKRSNAIQLFALQNGFRVETVREYVRLIDSQARRKS